MRRLAKFLRHDWAGRALLLEALVWLSWAKLLLLTVPFRWIAPRLGKSQTETAATLTETERQLALRVSWAVQSVAAHVPLGFVCLPQAMAAKWMLRRRRLASTLYLGVARPDETKFTAHAWLRAGDKILTGRAESLTHTTLASFGEGA
ncbi:MAG: hypothetical protein RL514_1525 [Verrucomicrobiota bacterium]|jgi:hypothetical protein